MSIDEIIVGRDGIARTTVNGAAWTLREELIPPEHVMSLLAECRAISVWDAMSERQ